MIAISRTLERTRHAPARRGLALCALLAFAAGAASATPSVYHSPAGDGSPGRLDFDPASPNRLRTDEIQGSSSLSDVELWIDGGAVGDGNATGSGTLCEDGDGDELCAYEIVVTVSNITGAPVYLSSFAPQAPASYSVKYKLTPATNSTELRVVALDAATSPSADAMLVGTLTLAGGGSCTTASTLQPCAKISVTAGSAVDAGQQRFEISADPVPLVFVPEPGRALQLLAGILGLFLLHRRRACGGCAPRAP